MSKLLTTCHGCGLQCKRTSSLRLHERACWSLRHAVRDDRGNVFRPRATQHAIWASEMTDETAPYSDMQAALGSPLLNADSNSSEQDVASHASDLDELANELDPLGIHTSNPLSTVVGLHSNRSLQDPIRGSVAEPQTSEDDENTTAGSTRESVFVDKGRLASSSNSTSCIRQSFRDVTGRLAGAPLIRNYTSQDNERREQASTDFISDFDKGFAQWLYHEHISQNAITRLLRDPRMGTLHQLLSWTSAEELRTKITRMGTSVSERAGNWYEQDIVVKSSRTPSGKAKYHIRYRKVEDVVRFLLGHEGFKDSLVFEPYQLRTVDEPSRRVYSDMASADWWWETQMKIQVDGATIVPLIVASDKTQVTNHQGDLVAHAVYLTIGNLPATIRNSNKRPGCVLLAMLPTIKDGNADFQAEVFHQCMNVLFDPIKRISDGEGLDVVCADRLTRRCFPIIAVMSLDYEEQVKVTGVKSNSHCTMCTVSPDSREDLETSTTWRTHEATRQQIALQRQLNIHRTSGGWVHDVHCFAWGHRYTNIHRTLMVDVLHQLYKGVLMHVFEWVGLLLEDKMPSVNPRRFRIACESSSFRGLQKRVAVAPKSVVRDIIDKRFASIPAYKDIRIFKQLSAVKQWTGKQQKSILRQMLPVFTPLLEDIGALDAIRFLRAIVDFILLATYKSHDDDTLRYMSLALFRMNQFKEVFRQYRIRNNQRASNTIVEGHFNFPKFHSMVHYMDMIRWLGNAPDLETGHFEHKHVQFIKTPFKLTNRKIGWEGQIMDHHSRLLNISADFDISSPIHMITIAEKREQTEKPVQPTAAVDVSDFFGWPRKTLPYTKPDNVWRTVAEVEELLGSPFGGHFRQAAAVFVRESRNGNGLFAQEFESERRDPDIIEKDDSWASELRVKFHASIRCWKRTGQDPDFPEAVEQDIVRSAPNWQAIKGNARYDWVWVQEYSTTDTSAQTSSPIAFDGRLPANVRLIVSIEDVYSPRQEQSGRSVYTGVFVELYRPKVPSGVADDIHGMTLITPVPLAPWRGILRGRRIYPLTSVYHSIHVVPVDESHVYSTDMYINNTADWETYNMLWNPTWEADQAKEAENSRQRRRELLRERTDNTPSVRDFAAPNTADVGGRGRRPRKRIHS